MISDANPVAFAQPLRRLIAILGIWVLVAGVMRADALPWILLNPANDTRDPEMQAWDQGDSRNFVEVANRSEAFAGTRFQWSQIALGDVLSISTPFAELRFDAVKPMAFTTHEKATLQEWLTRGGFLLLFEDAYPYPQEVFRKNATLPVYEFFTRELPAKDPFFTVEHITDEHPIFHINHETSTVPGIAREIRETPHYRGRTLILYHGRPVAFFMGRYNFEEDNRWVPRSRPFQTAYSSELKSYYLIVNIYVYAMYAQDAPQPGAPPETTTTAR